MDLLFLDSSGIDWPRFWEIVFDATITVGFAAFVALLAIFGRWLLFREQQKRLHALALMRREGVKIRNKGARKNLSDSDLDKWKAEIKKWKGELFEIATQFSPVEAERLDTLDLMPTMKFGEVTNQVQVRALCNVSETLKRLQQLLEERVRPYFTP